VLLLISLTICNVDSASFIDFRLLLLLCFNHQHVIVDYCFCYCFSALFCNIDSATASLLQRFLPFSLLLFRLPCNYLMSASIFYSSSAIWILQFLLQLAPLAVLLSTPMSALLLPTSMQACFPLLRQHCYSPLKYTVGHQPQTHQFQLSILTYVDEAIFDWPRGVLVC